MFSVMIVEDEFLVRVGLKNMIDWQKLDMQVVAEAQNGQDAYDLYQELKPDIILTDIKMPVMDGLKLITLIRKTDKQTKIIILTCYQEFDTIYEASKLGVSDYILKLKMSPQDILNIVENVRDELLQEKQNNPVVSNLTASHHTLANAVLKHVIHNEMSATDFLSIFQSCTRRHDSIYYAMSALSFSCEFYIPSLIHNVLENILLMYDSGIVIQSNEGQYLLFLYCQKEMAQHFFLELVEQIEYKMKTLLNLSPSIGISSVSCSVHALDRLYQEAEYALGLHYYSQNIQHIQYGQSFIQQQYTEDLQLLKTRIHIYQPLSSAYYHVIMSEITLMETQYGHNRDDVINRFVRLMLWPTIHANGLHFDGVDNLVQQYTAVILKTRTFTKTSSCYLEFIEKLSVAHNSAHLVSPFIRQCLKLIDKQYATQITVQSIADQIGMSANYIGKLFHEELGFSIVSYVHQIRIEKAKSLLAETNLCLYEIASCIGFSDESYFSRIFKQLVGMRPGDYRKTIIADKGVLS